MNLRSVFLLLCLPIGSVPLIAAEIDGEVRTGAVPGLERAAIVQLLDGTRVARETYTGFDGRFEFTGITAKDYRLRVLYSGFAPVEVPVTFPPGSSKTHVPVTLTPPNVRTTIEAAIADERNVPKNAVKEYEKGLAFRKKNECGKAMSSLKKAVGLYDRFGDAYVELGNCSRQEGRNEEAESYYLKAVRHSSKIVPAVALSNLYVSLHRYDEARSAIQDSIRIHPTEGDLFFALARTFFEEGRMREAEAAAHEAHSRGHKLPDVHLLLGRIYLQTGNRHGLATQLETYLAENPVGPAAEQARATLAELQPEQ